MEKWAKKYSALFICVCLIRRLSWVQALVKDDGVGLCSHLILPSGYPCIEHAVVTEDGFVLGIQHIPYGIHDEGILTIDSRPPVFLQHGLFQGGDTWFQNSKEQSLGFILADSGFDVWVGNVRGTRWSYGHVSLSEDSKAFWDWSWEELAAYDLPAMIEFVYSVTGSKVYYVGHSQGTIMGLAAFTQSEVTNMIGAAALLSPISYLDHITSTFARTAVNMHLDEMMISMGIHQINFRTKVGLQLVDYVCALEDSKCGNLLTSITGPNCCFNNSRVDFYLQYEPHPSSTKNLKHLFQMIRKGTFEKFDYGLWGNIKHYGSFTPIPYDLSRIPKSFPLWMAYGGNDALADIVDFNRTLSELKCDPELVYLESYGHLDFIYSVQAKEDLYDSMVKFFRSQSSTSYT
ncbi:triacylglycerol lipase 1 isoform X2 [Cryptomeria japonica]|nr:triacylglycerol lipase 1 isoform X2 [Cryptomeria japonica]